MLLDGVTGCVCFSNGSKSSTGRLEVFFVKHARPLIDKIVYNTFVSESIFLCYAIFFQMSSVEDFEASSVES